MLTVYKYSIRPSEEEIKLSIPGGGPVLSAGVDPIGQLCVWALADTDKPEEDVSVYCIGTGWPLDWITEQEEALNFVGSLKDGPYMWHVFTGGK